MKKLLLLLLFVPLVSLSQDRFLSREIDSVLAHEGGLLTTMANKSLKQQKKWRKANKSKFSKDVNKYKPFTTSVTRVEENGKTVYVFTHSLCWMRAFGCEYATEKNSITIDGGDIQFNVTKDEAISKLEEAKKLLDLEVLSQKEYDSLKNYYTPIILKN